MTTGKNRVPFPVPGPRLLVKQRLKRKSTQRVEGDSWESNHQVNLCLGVAPFRAVPRIEKAWSPGEASGMGVQTLEAD